ncbi:MAG: FHA domain-containing protein [Betaproteobacteria bacterium]
MWFVARVALASLTCLFIYRAFRMAGLFEFAEGGLEAPHAQRPARCRGELEVESGPGVPSGGERFALGAVTVLGRAPDSDIVILDPYVSARHAEIVFGKSGFFVRDLGSVNGTYVNGRRLGRERRLQKGDRLELGDTIFRFRG